MPRLVRSSFAAGLALLAFGSTAAQASTDQWVRWNIADADDRGATIRSIDFTAIGQVSAASEDDGVFDSFNAGLTFSAANGGLTGNAGAMNVRQVVNDNAGSLWAATSV